MNNSSRKIVLFLLVIIILPIIFFTSRELLILSENESVLSEIYKKQIESLLFSTNQYSEDLVRSWGARIEVAFIQSNGNQSEFVKLAERIFQDIPALHSVSVSDSDKINNIILVKEGEQVVKRRNEATTQILLKQKEQILRKLYEYRRINFVKIEPVVSEESEDIQNLIFIFGDNKICVLSFNKIKFVLNNLAAKIKNVTRDDYSISVYDSTTNKEIYSSNGLSTDEFIHSRKTWLIPGYTLRIHLVGESLDNVIRNRTYSSILLIGALAIFMILVAWYGYRNIRREVELAQIKNEFVSNVSHELRTPLALINMFAETLVLGRVKTEEKKNEYYTIIQNEAERLSKIVNKILNFSKIEAGKWKYNFEDVNLNALVGKIFSNYKFHLQNKGFQISFAPDDNLCNVKLDNEAVSEALVNLIDNAYKYSGEDKNIQIRTGTSGNYIFVEVEDKGVGVSDEDQKKIFEKFYRAPNGNVHNTKGTGLGLSLVKHIMDAHKGKVVIKSEINKGSKFTLLFPIDESTKEKL